MGRRVPWVDKRVSGDQGKVIFSGVRGDMLYAFVKIHETVN